MTCFYCSNPTPKGIVRCKNCEKVTFKEDISMAKKLEIREKSKNIDNFQRANNISV